MTQDETQAVVVADDRNLAAIKAEIARVPTAQEDPTPAMLRYILEAPDAASWEAIFESESFKDHAGDKVRVHTFRAAPSQFPESRLGVFLVCDVTFLETGERDVMTVGSEMAMAQLVNCWKRGDLPHDFQVIRKERPTLKGFHPMRLKSIRTAEQIAAGQAAG